MGSSKDELERWRAEIERHWGTEEMAKRFLENVAPSHANDPDWVRWEARGLRHGASPAVHVPGEDWMPYAGDVDACWARSSDSSDR